MKNQISDDQYELLKTDIKSVFIESSKRDGIIHVPDYVDGVFAKYVNLEKAISIDDASKLEDAFEDAMLELHKEGYMIYPRIKIIEGQPRFKLYSIMTIRKANPLEAAE